MRLRPSLSARSRRLLDPYRRLLLQAALGEGAQAAEAYRAWRASIPLDDIDFTALRVLPHLVETATRHGVDDPELPRIRGAAKHTWLRNMLRTRSLGAGLAALQNSGIDALLVKGAALFARYPQLAAFRGTGDYDVLVRQSDAPAAVAALARIGFRPDLVPVDRFTGPDFDMIHAAPLLNADTGDCIDLHWWPTPEWSDRAYVAELFAHAEPADFAGRRVRVPGLADHLFLTVTRQPPHADEIFLRAVEAAHLLRACDGKLDWQRFLALVRRFEWAGKAAGMLALIRTEISAPVPDEVFDQLGDAPIPRVSWEATLHATPLHRRTRWHGLAIKIIDGVWYFLRIVRAAGRPFAPSRGDELDRIWRERAARGISVEDGPLYLEGFSFQEEHGRWTDGSLAVIAFPCDRPAGARVQVRLRINRFFSPGWWSFSFDACGGEGLARRYVLRRGAMPAEVTVDAMVVGSDRPRIVIVLRLLDASRYVKFEVFEDVRCLGVMIERAEIVPDTEQAHAPSAA
jgi:putative nucleotidyltransferase-like protein